MTTVIAQLQQRSGTSSQWSTANPVLLAGEHGFDATLKKFKIGDGTTAWNSLPFATYTPAEVNALIADFQTSEDVQAALVDYVPKNEYTGQAGFAFELKASPGDPEDAAPTRYSEADRLKFRKAYQHEFSWFNSSVIPTVGAGTDEMAFYWYRGYNVDRSLPGEHRIMESFEAWYKLPPVEVSEWHIEGTTRANGVLPGQPFRCDAALYPRERFDHPISQIDGCSRRNFSYQVFAINALTIDPSAGQYGGPDCFRFDFRAGKREFLVNHGSRVHYADANTPVVTQTHGLGPIPLPYIDDLARTHAVTEIYAEDGIFVPTGERLRLQGDAFMGLDSTYTLAKLDDASGFFSGYNITSNSGLKTILASNAYGIRQSFDRVAVHGIASASAGAEVPELFRFQAAAVTSFVPIQLGSDQLRFNGNIEVWNTGTSARGNLSLGILTCTRVDASLGLFGNKVVVGTNQVEITQDGFGLQMPSFRASLAAFGGSSRVGTIAINVSPNTTSGHRGLVVEQSSANNGDLFSIDVFAAAKRVACNISQGLTWKPLTSASPDENGQLVFQRTSDTSLTLKMQGDDGVVRSVSLTLS